MNKEKDAVLQKADNKAKKPKRRKSDACPGESENSFIGKQVHGIVDGSFDAGYLLTVRVGDSPTVLRGLVFEPGLSVPLSNINDIAPRVTATNRDQRTALATLIRPNLVVGSATGSSPASRIEPKVPSTHAQSTAVTTQSTPKMAQPPSSTELEQGDSEQADPVAREKERNEKHADLVAENLELVCAGLTHPVITGSLATKQEQVGVGYGGHVAHAFTGSVVGAGQSEPMTTDPMISEHAQVVVGLQVPMITGTVTREMLVGSGQADSDVERTAAGAAGMAADDKGEVAQMSQAHCKEPSADNELN